MVVLQEGSPISKEELWSAVRVAKALLSRFLSLAGRPALGRVLVVTNVFHLRFMEATVFLMTFNAVDIVWYLSPDLCLNTILSQCSIDNIYIIIFELVV